MIEFNLKTSLFFLMLAGTLVCAQDKKIEKAAAHFDDMAYVDAINSYEDLEQKGYSSEKMYKDLANANYLNSKYTEAVHWYAKLFALEKRDSALEEMYRYAVTLKSIGDYKTSDIWMQKFSKEKTKDLRSEHFRIKPDYLEIIKNNSGRYQIGEISINSSKSDFAPSFYSGQLIFASARDTGLVSRRIDRWNKKAFFSIYIAKKEADKSFTKSALFAKNIKTRAHQSSTVFTKDGKTLYFTMNNFKGSNFARNNEGVSHLHLYRATLINGEWSNVTALPFNSEDYSVAHPALSEDEKTLYFASDMPGTLGKSDIFKVDIYGDGTYGIPTNLGPTINTEARETFPFISPSNVLYFASDGHPGLGGLDMFAVKLYDPHNTEVINLGAPLNSAHDDFSLIIDEESKSGFFASNREGGMGSDDIYSLKELQPLPFKCYSDINGSIIDQQSGKILVNAKIALDSKYEKQILVNDGGRFYLKLDCGLKTLNVNARNEEYEDTMVTIDLTKKDDLDRVVIALEKKKDILDEGTDLFEALKLKPIHFENDKYEIKKDSYSELDQILAFLNKYPELKIQVRSHTDSKGGDEYNQILSQKRAESTVFYFTSRGIDSSRISGVGFGESQLQNDCRNGSNCSEKIHALNRRSEFIIVK
ncbi:OmpA family protein [Arenibacter sp. 6A1]|uniref:OmpA family protein n=1 Tax=Arenibacter sp. 6A1 TaxID=2720391 RepID=UPI001447DCC7|nr:OmpA family protein [Arenibacter sp. 6A1]NKI28433.1 OmpA family protein [Arenibacter sp. 6A1]